MTSIKLLEERVSELENRIYGSKKEALATRDTPPENTIVDDLLHANTLISSTLSGREKTNSVVKRLHELSDMLDPSYEGDDLGSDAKLELLLAMESDIRAYAESVEHIERLSPALDLDHLRDMPELLPKLNKLTLDYVDYHQESEQLARDVWSLFNEYNDIVTSIAKTLISINMAVSAAEAAASPKKQLD